MPVRKFRTGSVRNTGFVSHFVYKRTKKGNFEKPQKFNEFSKLSTKIMYELYNEQSKREFYYHESNNNKNNNIENDDSMSRYTYVRYVV